MLENVLMVSRGIKDWGGEAEERGRGRVRPRNGREGGRGGAMNGMGALSLGSPSGFCGHPGGWRNPGRSLPGQGRAPPASQTPSGPLERGAGRDGQGPAWAEQGSGGEGKLLLPVLWPPLLRSLILRALSGFSGVQLRQGDWVVGGWVGRRSGLGACAPSTLRREHVQRR
ncbi:hypothetical protein PCL_08936 [Purpureocillium lilacinum]|uniref:Uncharacterized protein n=1 Tax=Purpureocillium lilacinum TaxID=33203 RepID=A0A2U3EGU5_PURLI|nr:hypothetical protein PCL_08936 [Purpureocillium lilacinum]